MPGRLVCTPDAPCDAHRDGASKRNKCPGLCDRPGCRRPATTEIGPRGLTVCDHHAEQRGRGHPVTTGSDGVPVVAFRLGAADHRRAMARAKKDRVTVGELARRALLERLG